MKRGLFVVDGYYRHNVPNTLCVERIVEKFGTEIQADILSIENNEVENSKNVYTLIYNTVSSNSIQKIISKVKKFFCIPIGHPSLVRKLCKKIKELDLLNDYDVIIPVMNPVETVEATYKYKSIRKDVKVIVYEIDPNSNRYKFPKNIIEFIWKYKSTQWEKKIYRRADYIIHMKTHKKHFDSSVYRKFRKKTIYLDIPSFKVHKMSQRKIQGKMQFLYAGAFYPELRNPFKMLDIIRETSKKIPLELHIYTGNNMWKELKEYEKKNNFLFVHEGVSQSEIQDLMGESDVLVSLGNKESDFLPSKTLEYIGTLKPIIHFKQDEYDTSTKYFEKYGRAFIIDQTNGEEAANSLICFLKSLYKNGGDEYMIDENVFYENTGMFSATEMKKLILSNDIIK